MAEVGLPHSSDETCESRWSEGGSKQSIPERKQTQQREAGIGWNMKRRE